MIVLLSWLAGERATKEYVWIPISVTSEPHHALVWCYRKTTLNDLRQQTVLAQVFPGGAPHPASLLSFRQAVHLASHWGQIRTIRNLYRTTRGAPGRFFPHNPTFPA
jgi:hypothetical protein